ncbi:MAG TPA: protein kinase [Acetobacteraceae bacterium]|nr:protein kinase [Acetobacteraceae bacterium]
METIEALGKYEIKRTLGRGAMGTVYEGWDPIIARRVAVKTVKLPDSADPETEDALARFRREAQAAGRLTHPNIVAVYDYGETSDLAYIVMEFVDGPPLKALLDKHERFALADTVRVMQDLLAGLQFSHERGVVHRDIKPANVMLTSTGQAKIADFGIARIESSSMTQAGTLLGTPAYMSPEQFMAQVVDSRTDIYSSGVLLYQLLTGERPFDGGMSAIMHKALNTEPPAPSQLSVTAPPSFDAVVRRAMAKRPEDRFPTASAFAEAMQAALARQAAPAIVEDESTLVATPAQPPPRPAATPVAQPVPPAPVGRPATRRSSLPLVAAVAGAVLAIGGGGAWWLLSHSPSPRPAVVATGNRPATSAAPAETPAPSTDAPPNPVVAIAPPPVGQPSVPIPNVPPNPVSPPPPAVQAPAANPSAQPNAVAMVPPPPVVQPPVPQPPPQPVVVKPTPAELDVLRHRIGQWASGQSCTLLDGDVGESGAATFNGFAGHGTVDDLRTSLLSILPPSETNWQVAGVNRVFCAALTALHRIAPPFGSPGPRLGLQMDGKSRLHDGEPVRVRLVMPDFAARLRVDYIGHDGIVQHLYPQLADAKNAITADPPRTFAAGEPVNLGNPSWVIGEPYGTDMIIAVASTEPLFDRPRPSNQEKADVYLRDLQTAIDGLRQRNAHLAGAAVTLDALP